MGRPIAPFLVLSLAACSASPAPPPPPPPAPPLRFAVDAARMKRDVETLTAFGTRHTLSDTTSPTRGIGAARRWILTALQRAAEGTPMRAQLEPHLQQADGKRVPAETDIEDVVAVLPGAMPDAASRRYYVV